MPETVQFNKADGTPTSLIVISEYAIVTDGEPMLIWDIEDGYSVRILGNPEISESDDDIYTGWVLFSDREALVLTGAEIETLALELFRHVQKAIEGVK